MSEIKLPRWLWVLIIVGTIGGMIALVWLTWKDGA
jgi:uncharacterized membrane protein